jgi:Heterokaryon incompatibility protein (HET)
MGQATEVALSDSDYSTEGEQEVLTEYEYKTLVEPHTVRILTLRPGGKEAGEVVCQLVDENLDEVKSKYEALSWSWGTVEWHQKIQIHHRGKNFSFKVPGSLTSALKALRRVKRVRRLWIDAICINQKESDEKNKQVPMMARIYGGASRVCIWLVEGDPDGRHAVALDFI